MNHVKVEANRQIMYFLANTSPNPLDVTFTKFAGIYLT